MTDHVEVTVDMPDGRRLAAGSLQTVTGAQRTLSTPTFRYSSTYLAEPDSYALSPDLPLDGGLHWPRDGRDMFSAFRDAMPDAWGRRLIRDKHRRAAAVAHQRPAAMTDLDLLLAVDDTTRQGALRFWSDGTPQAHDTASSAAEPSDLTRLADAADRYARDVGTPEDLEMLLGVGSTPGGARPKAIFRDERGRLCLAKFPLTSDPRDVSSWEQATMSMQRAAGITVADSSVIPLAPGMAVFVTTKFDRDARRRVGYMSFSSAFEVPEGERVPYSVLARRAARLSPDPDRDSAELFRRAAFAALASNNDDHMRNHGLLRHTKGWSLSPAFDVNPNRMLESATPLTPDDDPVDRDIRLLFDAASEFRLTDEDALAVVRDVATATRRWREAAIDAGVRPDALDSMERAFEHENRARVEQLRPTSRHVLDLTADDRSTRPHRRPQGSPGGRGGQFGTRGRSER